MAKYDYRCNACQVTFEVERPMADPRSDISCPSCSGKDVSRVFGLGSIGLAGLPTRKDK